MKRNPALPESHATDQMRFQLSLIHLLYPTTGSSTQLNELECLMSAPVDAVRAR